MTRALVLRPPTFCATGKPVPMADLVCASCGTLGTRLVMVTKDAATGRAVEQGFCGKPRCMRAGLGPVAKQPRRRAKRRAKR